MAIPPKKSGSPPLENPVPNSEATRFQPGQSGNPIGPPKGHLKTATMIKLLLAGESDKVDATTNTPKTKLQAMIDAQILMASTPGPQSTAAFAALLDRVDGKPKQTVITEGGMELVLHRIPAKSRKAVTNE